MDPTNSARREELRSDPCDTDASEGGTGQPTASEKQIMASFSWRREGIDGEFKPPGLCPCGKARVFL